MTTDTIRALVDAKADIEQMIRMRDTRSPAIVQMRAWVAAIEAALATAQPQGVPECCVPDDGEPSFVLLGRDPQAPALIETWAADRERAEPSSNKPGRARAIAAAMREFKAANPGKGMPADALAAAPTPHGGEDARDAERYRNLVKSGKFVPSIDEGRGWGMRLAGRFATKQELDAAADAAGREVGS